MSDDRVGETAPIKRWFNRSSNAEGPENTADGSSLSGEEESSRRSALASLVGGGAVLGGGAALGAFGMPAQPAHAATAHNIHYVGQGDTIEGAINAVGEYGEIVVTPGYDSGAENFPITVDKSVHIRGDHGTKIANSSGSTNIFNIRVGGIRPPGPVFENLHLEGGKDAFNAHNSRYCIFQNVHIEQPGRDGVTITQNTEADNRSSNTHRLFGVSVEQAGRHGFVIGQATHAVDLVSCEAQLCGGKGLYIHSAFAMTVLGGVFQYNGDKGIHAEGSNALAIYNVYLEDNDDDSRNDTAFNKVAGAVVDGCYFNGNNIKGSGSNNQNAIFLKSCTNMDIRACTYRDYRNAFIDLYSGNGDIDVHRGTHFPINTSHFFEETNAERPRSHGTIGAATGGVDLGSVQGRWVGDSAVSNGSRGVKKGLYAVWTGSAWQPSDGSSPV